ncbi:Asp-tRNA(Asn)/Glu-tRNA(Gln) amidotransferase subunit GatB [Caminibacter pacificus]|uniref:Aspartyl/glutamyl-tRNA(Asn/Gln) amidotransferase subunit B n=1 Tax=Caminibacter pacificus TaxID=1424653 RepID=A0AAJ4REL5_9BACT|nr:Asp-tRNA(Asn)/Glu-tRNA(Gln) amidotransferase subunit GatB [Caminibacter pacificus]NPA87294.1 Asp-tRNA(Asn)/Glu-tRNA(Gln) amidotransferase subunit GatB [Campylobacterota bacterium]QCI28088.1 Asp-tRNA(Asn)/Glu-tRNA(Gln) amidotransferase subunit GatB [Caminibacter pacificus]ROR41204.1 aspartyl/glutamyl-tRNA(Asn/Gln) amidotransferase subunit B [Caminibacter pacificus]
MSSKYEVVIGLEVHVQLNTKTKIFCNCPTSFGDEPNTNTCPTCLGLPGALPVMNKEAVRKAVMFGKAVNATINKRSTFERKNYFYPDLPKGYQISQFVVPIVENGELFIDTKEGTKRIGITRAHLEEDAGKNIHEGDYSKVDLNRAGTPLLEIVSEPDMRSSDEAIAYLKKLHAIVKYLGISDANMQEGSFRVDANVSVRPKGQKEFGTRVEIKNINSFKFIKQAIDYEVERHIEAYEYDEYEEEVVQETRLFNSKTGETRSMRGKEESADYRYFPDPDLLPLEVPEEFFDIEIPELPDEKKERYMKEFGLKEYDAGVLTAEPELAKFFEEMIELGVEPAAANRWLAIELLGRLNKAGISIENSPVSPKKLALIAIREKEAVISGAGGKKVLDLLMEEDIEVDVAIDKLGLKQVSDEGAIEKIVDEVLAANADKVEEYKAGKEKLFGFFVGQVMKASKGKANPQIVNKILKSKLS